MPFALRVAAAAILMVGLLAFVDLRDVIWRLQQTNVAWLALALLVSAVGVVVSAAKWRQLLRERHIALGFLEAVRFYWIGMFFSNFLPSSISGDAVRVTLTRGRGSPHEVAASILVERVTGLIVLLALLAVALFVQQARTGDMALPRSAWLAVAAVTAGLALTIALPRRLATGIRRRRRRLPRVAHRPILFLERLLHVTAAYRANHRAIARALLLSLPFYATIFAAHAAVLLAVGTPVGPAQVLLVAPLVSLVSVVPLLPNGVGLAEGAFVLLYVSVGVSPESAFLAALLRRAVDLLNSAIGGGVWALDRRGLEPRRARAVPATSA